MKSITDSDQNDSYSYIQDASFLHLLKSFPRYGGYGYGRYRYGDYHDRKGYGGHSRHSGYRHRHHIATDTIIKCRILRQDEYHVTQTFFLLFPLAIPRDLELL